MNNEGIMCPKCGVFHYNIVCPNCGANLKHSIMYKFDKSSLQFVRVKWLDLSIKLFIGIVVSILVFGLTIQPKKPTETEILVYVSQHNQFSEEKLVNMIKELHFAFPYIVYAQAELESGFFQSAIFKENNNLFGMKSAAIRINNSKGTQNEHAYYNTWTESLYDYALYSATYLSSLKNEDDYFDYLSKFYAQDIHYVIKLKNIIEKQQLKSKFN
jgi:hypothetical protein